MEQDLQVLDGFPGVDDYLQMRKQCGLSAMSRDGAEIGLPNTIYGVRIEDNGRVIGMGRLIGDGGCFLQVVDIAVLPQYQKRGLSRKIMEKLMAYIEKNVDESTFVSLFADVGYLYQKFGFEVSGDKMPGMVLRRPTKK